MVLQSLVRSRKFWLAVFGVLSTVITYYIPDFPPEIWESITLLVGVLIAAIAVEDAAMKLSGRSHSDG